MNLLTLLRISRPALWFAPFIVFLVSFSLSGASFSAIAVLQLLALSILFSFFLYAINDIHDYESDRRNARKSSVFHGVVLEKKHHPQAFRLALLSGLLVFCVALLTRNLFNIIATGLLLSLAYAYSAPPLRLKSIPFIDSLSNAALFMLVWFIGSSYSMRFTEIPGNIYLLSLGAAAAHLFGTIPDAAADKAAGNTTVATKFGTRAAAAIAALVFAALYASGAIHNQLIRFLLLGIGLCYALAAGINRQRVSLFLGVLAYAIFGLGMLFFFYQHLYIRGLFF